MSGHLGGAEGDVTFGQEGLGAVGSEFHFLVRLRHFLEDLATAAWFGARGCGGFAVGIHDAILKLILCIYLAG